MILNTQRAQKLLLFLCYAYYLFLVQALSLFSETKSLSRSLLATLGIRVFLIHINLYQYLFQIKRPLTICKYKILGMKINLNN